MRHAEAHAASATVKDFDRALSEKGFMQAKKAGSILKQIINLPMVVVCSPALRTQQTLGALHLANRLKTEFVEKLYYGNVTDYLSIIASHTETDFPVLVIGHNPTISSVIATLRRRDEISCPFVNYLKPAGFALIDFPENTKPDFSGKGHLVCMMEP